MWSRQLLNRWKGSIVFKASANWENATEAFGLTLTSSVETGKSKSPGRTWNQRTCRADNDSLSALCFDQMINKVKATAQRCSMLALAHRATPAPGSICSQLLWLKGRQEDYSWSIRRTIQILLMLQRAKADTVSGKCQMCYDSHHTVLRKGEKNLSFKIWEKVQKVCCREKIYLF